jgi:hypothetical protein
MLKPSRKVSGEGLCSQAYPGRKPLWGPPQGNARERGEEQGWEAETESEKEKDVGET